MNTKKILGLDLGVTSIGWSLIKEENEKPTEIIGMGVRIIPLDTDESDEFTKGKAISKNQKRTARRTVRKGYYRYVLRRKALTAELQKNGMFDEKLFNLPQLELWGLRAKAVKEKIGLTELGRVLYHLNQKRGYKSSRSEENAEKKDTEYVAEVKNRYQLLKEEGKTIGQKFFEELSKNKYYRTKQQVFPREAYIEEFDAIMRKQQEFYPDVLTDEFIKHLRDDIIYFQRKLKSQKGLVSICEFEGFHVKNKDGKEIFTGPKVAHRSNPLFQIEKIWESINNISIKDKRNNEFPITLEQKQKIFEYLDNHEKLSQSELFKILGIKDKSGWFGNKMLSKGLQGNLTKIAIKNALNNDELANKWLKFEIKIQPTGNKTYQYNPDTGEVINELEGKIVSEKCIDEPLYQLWHTIYSIADIDECKSALIKKFGFDEATAEGLAKIDYTKQSYGNKSVKAIRKILPYLMDGYKYSDAASIAGYNHSNSLTKEQVQARQLLDKIPLLHKNALRQPVVEKILNQMIHIVNDIIDEKRGWVTKEEREKGLFEIRIELARELKQSKEERNETFKNISKIERENKEIEKRLQELGLRATRKNIIKYRLFNEINGEDKKVNAMCIYTGKTFSLTDALQGNEIDVEHIIPKSLLFDDSQSNKTLTFRWVNQEKGDRTAYDYMASKGEAALNEYIERVNKLYKDGIIKKAKRDKLLMPGDKIPKDFIERQLRESQYIARKSREILTQIAKNVWSTSGSVTEYLRRLWGWEDVLMNLQMQRIKEIIPNPLAEGITEMVEWETHDGQKHQKEVIKDWTKRDDHRHHAIDALTVACTKQGYIQRINTLSAKATRDELYKAVSERKEEFRESLSLLDKYFISQRPFTTKEVEQKAAEIIVSFKPGKKVATWGKRFIKKNGKRIKVQDHILVPRGPLSEASVYGKVNTIMVFKPLLDCLNLSSLNFKSIVDRTIKEKIYSLNQQFENNVSKIENHIKKEGIKNDFNTKLSKILCYNYKDIKYLFENPHLIFKPYIKELVEKRLAEHNGNVKKALASLKNDPIYLDENKTIPLEYGTCYKEEYVLKYPIESIKEKDVPFIVDKKIRELVTERLKQYNGKEKEPFKEPLFLDASNTIPIRTVRMFTGLSAVEPIKYDKEGRPIAFVKPGNNHHIAIYEDEQGNKIPHLCTFWHAVERKKYGIPVIIENPQAVWDKILTDKEKYPQSFLEKLPGDNWKFLISLQENELFAIGIKPLKHLNDLPKKELSNYIYRVQKMSDFDIFLRHNYETTVTDNNFKKITKKFLRISSVKSWFENNPVKIEVNKLGEIVMK